MELSAGEIFGWVWCGLVGLPFAVVIVGAIFLAIFFMFYFALYYARVFHCIYYFTPEELKRDPEQSFSQQKTLRNAFYCGCCDWNSSLCLFQIRHFWKRAIIGRIIRLFYFCCGCIFKRQENDDILPFTRQQLLEKKKNKNNDEGMSLSPPPPVFLNAPPHTFPMSSITVSAESLKAHNNSSNSSRGGEASSSSRTLMASSNHQPESEEQDKGIAEAAMVAFQYLKKMSRTHSK
ncbi:hypothetical protein BDA99DRAFT_564278 [Phascolomyces articulosus]|uniref:Uncharacterized protein n=1 Tax=Phascolomyces articulosus TaxID=60185 RepID=A0AAD5K036_9FUNG|nr:hypothetical protein BDA99DRAFT_564278 [Phascolomyces articulosus]